MTPLDEYGPATRAHERFGSLAGVKLATPEEIAGWDIDVRPDGAGIPEGRGSVSEGRQVFNVHCVACHGPTGTEGPNDRLVDAARKPSGAERNEALVAFDRAVEDLATLRAVVERCTRCPLHEMRANAVFGEGDPSARELWVYKPPTDEPCPLVFSLAGPGQRWLTGRKANVLGDPFKGFYNLMHFLAEERLIAATGSSQCRRSTG